MCKIHMAIRTNSDVLLDDGVFFVQHSCNYPASIANGFLMRRCRVSLRTPEGSECIGGYYLQLDGNWRADIAGHHDRRTGSDCRLLGSFGNRLDAIHALWTHRHDALTRHPSH